MEISEVRQRLRQRLESARRTSTERRARSDAAAAAYERFLGGVATPIFRMLASALKAEGHAFVVFTPAGSVRLASERSAEDYIELLLDTDSDPPHSKMRVGRARGRRTIEYERALRPETDISHLTEDDVLQVLLEEIADFVIR